MTEDQCATALFETLQIIKKHLGTEKTIGMVLGAAIGEALLAGQSKDQVDALVTQSWEKFQEQLKQRG